MQVKVGNEVATGTGPNKKIAKKNAAEAMLLQLGYKASTSLQDQLDKTGENKGWSGPKAGFPEPTNNSSITPTVELNGLAMKRGEPAIYRPLDPKPFPNYRANYNFRGMYNQRYHCPMPKIFYVQLTVGNNEFFWGRKDSTSC